MSGLGKGTRADFYIGIGQKAEWLGSLAFDGYRIADMKKSKAKAGDYKENPDNKACWEIKSATTEEAFREAVKALLAINDDATTPDQGWPWPWETSATTDYTYAFSDGKCQHWIFDKTIDWPNMKDRQNVTFGHRSGFLILGG